MVSVASDGAADRIAARTLSSVLRAGSGTRARYSSTVFGAALRFGVEPRPPDFDFFGITETIVLRSSVSHIRGRLFRVEWIERTPATSQIGTEFSRRFVSLCRSRYP